MPGRSWRAGQPCGDGKPVGPDRPLEKGVRGIYQGIIRCRAVAGVQGKHRVDGKPAGPDRPLEKGVGGIEKESILENLLLI